MQLYVMAMRDINVDAFGTPFYVSHVNHAVRDFGDEVRRSGDKNNKVNLHPEHYELYHLGLYDDSGAKFELFERPRQICVGTQFVLATR